MNKFERLSHTSWDCNYHVIFIPKRRRGTLSGELRMHLGEMFQKLAAQKESEIVEGHLMHDHEHMIIAISPKYAVSQVIGFIKASSTTTVCGIGTRAVIMSFLAGLQPFLVRAPLDIGHVDWLLLHADITHEVVGQYPGISRSIRTDRRFQRIVFPILGLVSGGVVFEQA